MVLSSTKIVVRPDEESLMAVHLPDGFHIPCDGTCGETDSLPDSPISLAASKHIGETEQRGAATHDRLVRLSPNSVAHFQEKSYPQMTQISLLVAMAGLIGRIGDRIYERDDLGLSGVSLEEGSG